LRCFETGSHFLFELTKTTGHCSLLTSASDPENFDMDSDHRIRSRENGSGYIKIFMDFLHKTYLFGKIEEMQENSKMFLTP
jgi:hypothetical protein